jgi:hypothetical protein
VRLLATTAFILLRGLKNRAVAQVRRVRQPRYLLATVIGLGWWWLYFGRFLGTRLPGSGLDPAWRAPLELFLAGLALLFVALAWLFGTDRGALTFSEAEIQFLFPAPLSRRQLVHYKLLRLLGTGLVGAALAAFFFGRSTGGSPLLFALGSWVALTTLSFHNLAASFTRAGLARHGLRGAGRFLATLAVLAALAAGLWWAARAVRPPALSGHPREDLLAWATALGGSPLAWALWPVLAPIRLALAPDARAFAVALPGALAMLGLHYAWVMATVLHFEDDAVRDAERRARLLEALRQGTAPPVRAGRLRRPPFRLAPRGRPEVAFLWKGLIATGRLANLRVLLALALTLGALAAALWLSRAPGLVGGGAPGVLGMLAALAWAYLALFGPGLVRADLRSDLPNLEVLRALPVSGAALVRGQLAAPLAVLSALQWLCLPVAALLLPGDAGPGLRAALALAAALVGPAFTLVALVLQNGFVVLLPGWVPTGPDRTRGPEALGLRLISALGHLLALGLALLPAAVLGGGLGLGAFALLGAPGLVIGAAAGALALAAEAWLATGLLGRAFDRLDPSGL